MFSYWKPFHINNTIMITYTFCINRFTRCSRSALNTTWWTNKCSHILTNTLYKLTVCWWRPVWRCLYHADCGRIRLQCRQRLGIVMSTGRELGTAVHKAVSGLADKAHLSVSHVIAPCWLTRQSERYAELAARSLPLMFFIIWLLYGRQVSLII